MFAASAGNRYIQESRSVSGLHAGGRADRRTLYIDGTLIRSDITEDHPGIPLRLRIVVLDGVTLQAYGECCCQYLALRRFGCLLRLYCQQSGRSANVPWHGTRYAPGYWTRYGNVRRTSTRTTTSGSPLPRRRRAPAPSVRPAPSTDKTRFFRGIQMTDKEGIAEFVTIYPAGTCERHPHSPEGANAGFGDKRNVPIWTRLSHRATILSRRPQ